MGPGAAVRTASRAIASETRSCSTRFDDDVARDAMIAIQAQDAIGELTGSIALDIYIE